MPFEPPPYFQKQPEVCEVRFLSADKSNIIAGNKTANKTPIHSTAKPTAKPSPQEARSADIIDIKTLPGIFKSMPYTSMKLPAGIWQYEKLEYQGPYGYNILLTAKDNEQVILQFSSPGVYFADESHFKAIMAKAPHELTKAEMESINISSTYKTAKTEDLNGKRVITMFGKEADEGKDVYNIEFNQNPDKSNVLMPAEITFTASPAEFKKRIDNVKAALKTIKWHLKINYAPERQPASTAPKDECQD